MLVFFTFMPIGAILGALVGAVGLGALAARSRADRRINGAARRPDSHKGRYGAIFPKPRTKTAPRIIGRPVRYLQAAHFVRHHRSQISKWQLNKSEHIETCSPVSQCTIIVFGRLMLERPGGHLHSFKVIIAQMNKAPAAMLGRRRA
jgi:hypothetical protein